MEELLPYTIKNSHEKLRKRVENGLRVKGTGIGQRVKGKESERSMKGRYVWIFILHRFLGRKGEMVLCYWNGFSVEYMLI